MDNICLCIPRVDGNTTESHVRTIFNELKLGIIDRIVITTKTNDRGEKTKRVFIHMKKWFDCENADIARKRFALGKDIKVMHNAPWYWKITASRSQRKDSAK